MSRKGPVQSAKARSELVSLYGRCPGFCPNRAIRGGYVGTVLGNWGSDTGLRRGLEIAEPSPGDRRGGQYGRLGRLLVVRAGWRPRMCIPSTVLPSRVAPPPTPIRRSICVVSLLRRGPGSLPHWLASSGAPHPRTQPCRVGCSPPPRTVIAAQRAVCLTSTSSVRRPFPRLLTPLLLHAADDAAADEREHDRARAGAAPRFGGRR